MVACLGILGFGLALFASANTRAEKGANWMIKGSNISASLEPRIQNQEVEGSGLPLTASFVIVGLGMEYRCANFELVKFTLLSEGSAAGKVRFTGCQFFIKGAFTCAPEVNGEPGIIETTALKALIVLHKLEGGSTDPLLRVEPVEGIVLAGTKMPKECPIGGGNFGGVVYIKDGNGKFASEEATHLAAIGPLTKVSFDVEKSSVSLGGSAVIGLTGGHSGEKWSGLPS